jgi:hypothetical protein
MRLTDYRLFGYDIALVPGPPAQKDMFNFRALFNLRRSRRHVGCGAPPAAA